MRTNIIILALALSGVQLACAQSADWQNVVWREPQVRYLLADMTLGGVANTGCFDILTGITALKRKNSEHLVFVEEDYKAKVLL